jgi:uncharacterized protein YndB with AHSA1/START domain
MNDIAMTSTAQAIVVDEVLPHAPKVIWKTLTTADLIGRWLKMAPSGFEPVKGNLFTFKTTPAGEWDGTIRCQILELVKNERLAYTWESGHEGNEGYGSRLDSVVAWDLSRTRQGTRLRLVHSGFATPKNDSAYMAMSGAWKKVVHSISDIAGEAI